MNVGWLSFDRDRRERTGSARIRCYNLIKYAPHYQEFKVGRKYDAVVFQKFYWPDYAERFPGIKVLDVCDPDWLAGDKNIEFRRMLYAVDGVVCNTEATANYIRMLTKKPVIVIPDRHDMDIFKERKIHKGRAKSVVWFGYSHNAHVLHMYISKLQELGLTLTIMAEKFVKVSRGIENTFADKETFVQYPETIELVNNELIKHDFAILPIRRRPQEQYKSNNKQTHAWAVGLPVASYGDDIEKFMNAEARIEDQNLHYEESKKLYNCKLSVVELDQFLEDLQRGRNKAQA